MNFWTWLDRNGKGVAFVIVVLAWIVGIVLMSIFCGGKS